MDDDKDKATGRPDRPPSRTEQLRIVGAEEAGSLVGRAARGERAEGGTLDTDADDDGLESFRRPRPRSVFESIPDAPPSFLDDLLAQDATGDERRSRPAEAQADHTQMYRAETLAPPEDPPGPTGPPGSGEGRDPERTQAHEIRPVPAESASEDAFPAGHDPARDEPSGDPSRFGAVPVIKVENPPHEPDDIELPHWTEPPTGQVPKVLVDGDRRDDDSWSTYGASPRWRDPSTEWEAEDYSDVSDLGDDLPREGALADADRPTADDFFSFEDIDSPARTRRTGPTPVTPPAATDDRAASRGRTGPDRRPPGGPVGEGPNGAGPRNVPVAVGIGAALAVAAILLLRIGPGAMMVLVTLAVGIGAAELLATARKVGFHPATLVGLAGATGLPLAVYWRGPEAYPLVLFLAVAFSMFWYLFGIDTERPAHNIGITLLSVAYVGLFGSFAALILRAGKPIGTNMLLAVIIPTVAADVGAYFVGRNAGRSPLSPVSPGKTVEGALGGFAAAVTASVILNHFLLDLKPFGGLWDAAMLGVVIGIVGLLGDLSESLLKRGFGVKDMGSVIPEHGGVLDRFDALLFALPASYYLARLLDLLPT